ncbi:hypothetical protein CEQ90_18440 [Lewinellaceae bacterium SD302]|nr:hypothetical protein CEQ90_18440 [Lewinellaceae bacterium SD302]
MPQTISNSANLQLGTFGAEYLDVANHGLKDLPALLKTLGCSDGEITTASQDNLVVQGSVASAPDGVIQDPAGSAIGSGRKPAGGGGSGAIYAHFPDLEPVPAIQETEAIFNSSDGPGGRVLHSYSPHLHGVPTDPADAQRALQDLANAYLNALRAKRDNTDSQLTDKDLQLFNAVPLSGRIFAGSFINSALNHLHPSYTVAALLLAQAEMLRAGETLRAVQLYYYDAPVAMEAKRVVGEFADL